MLERGVEVDACARDISDCDVCSDVFTEVNDIPWSRSVLDLWGHWRAASAVRSLVEKRGYSIVHVHTPIAGFVLRWALRNLRKSEGVKVIYTAHGFHFLGSGKRISNWIFRSLETMAAKWCDIVITMNDEDFAAAQQICAGTSAEVRKFPGVGVDVSAYERRSVSENALRALREELNLSERSFAFLMVAEFNPGKRHRDLMVAFQRANLPSAVLLFAGEGKLEESIKLEARFLGIENQLRFLGFRRDILDLYEIADAVVLPSEREGLPRCVLEAMAMRVPVIGADVRGIRDLLRDGCGLLFPVGDVEALEAVIRSIVADSNLRESIVTKARERIENYRLEAVTRLHEELYQGFVSVRSASGSCRSEDED